MMYVVEAFRISTNDRSDIEVFENAEDAIKRAKEIETEDWHVFVTETTGEPGDEGNVIFDI
jgi:hypothetical protein